MYGQFIERRGRCIYGGVYESRSPLADELYAHAVNAHASSHARRRVDV